MACCSGKSSKVLPTTVPVTELQDDGYSSARTGCTRIVRHNSFFSDQTDDTQDLIDKTDDAQAHSQLSDSAHASSYGSHTPSEDVPGLIKVRSVKSEGDTAEGKGISRSFHRRSLSNLSKRLFGSSTKISRLSGESESSIADVEATKVSRISRESQSSMADVEATKVNKMSASTADVESATGNNSSSAVTDDKWETASRVASYGENCSFGSWNWSSYDHDEAEDNIDVFTQINRQAGYTNTGYQPSALSHSSHSSSSQPLSRESRRSGRNTPYPRARLNDVMDDEATETPDPNGVIGDCIAEILEPTDGIDDVMGDGATGISYPTERLNNVTENGGRVKDDDGKSALSMVAMFNIPDFTNNIADLLSEDTSHQSPTYTPLSAYSKGTLASHSPWAEREVPGSRGTNQSLSPWAWGTGSQEDLCPDTLPQL